MNGKGKPTAGNNAVQFGTRVASRSADINYHYSDSGLSAIKRRRKLTEANSLASLSVIFDLNLR